MTAEEITSRLSSLTADELSSLTRNESVPSAIRTLAHDLLPADDLDAHTGHRTTCEL